MAAQRKGPVRTEPGVWCFRDVGIVRWLIHKVPRGDPLGARHKEVKNRKVERVFFPVNILGSIQLEGC